MIKIKVLKNKYSSNNLATISHNKIKQKFIIKMVY